MNYFLRFILNRIDDGWFAKIPLPNSTENLALNKSTWKHGDGIFADRAVDGQKTSLSVYGTDCIPPTYTKTVEWRVDLGNILSIHHIFIQYATNNKQWGIFYYLPLLFLFFVILLVVKAPLINTRKP